MDNEKMGRNAVSLPWNAFRRQCGMCSVRIFSDQRSRASLIDGDGEM